MPDDDFESRCVPVPCRAGRFSIPAAESGLTRQAEFADSNLTSLKKFNERKSLNKKIVRVEAPLARRAEVGISGCHELGTQDAQI